MNLEEVQYSELRRTHAEDSTSHTRREMLLTTSVTVAFLGLVLLAAPAYGQTPGKNITQRETSLPQLDAQSRQIASQYTAPNRIIEAANGTTYAYRPLWQRRNGSPRVPSALPRQPRQLGSGP